MANQGGAGFDLKAFQDRLDYQSLQDGQRQLLDARLDLLKDFIRPQADSTNQKNIEEMPTDTDTKNGKEKKRNWDRDWENVEHAKRKEAMAKKDTWSFAPGSLTIVVSGSSRPTLSPSLFSGRWKPRTMFHLMMCPNDAFVKAVSIAPC